MASMDNSLSNMDNSLLSLSLIPFYSDTLEEAYGMFDDFTDMVNKCGSPINIENDDSHNAHSNIINLSKNMILHQQWLEIYQKNHYQ